MKKLKEYRRARFTADTIRNAANKFSEEMNSKILRQLDNAKDLQDKSREERLKLFTSAHMSVNLGSETWEHDCENEFFADYRKSTSGAVYRKTIANKEFRIQTFSDSVQVSVEADSRSLIESVFDIFEKSLPESRLAEDDTKVSIMPKVFIGHGGRSHSWKELKDHLHEKHNYPIEAYEIGARAGHAVRDVLEDMLSSSSFAVLVHTGEDATADGELRARQNVVHETGLFQGKLGFRKAIVLLEHGVEEFSNIHGIEQIRFSKGNIKETFGDVLATIKREYP